MIKEKIIILHKIIKNKYYYLTNQTRFTLKNTPVILKRYNKSQNTIQESKIEQNLLTE